MNDGFRLFLLAGCWGASVTALAAPPLPSLLAESVVSQEAFSKPVQYANGLNGLSFQQDALLSHAGWQYAAFYNAARHVCVARRKLPSGSWQTVELKDYTQSQDDGHNTISLGICAADGTIHLAFDHHDHPLRYRKSVPGLASAPETFAWEPSRFQSIQNNLTGPAINSLTYPRFLNAPSGKMLMEFRLGSSGNGHGHVYEYDGATAKWARIGSNSRYIQGDDNNGYVNGLDYDSTGRLHVTWCWRETSDVGSNHGLLYAYSEDDGRTWKNNASAQIGETGSRPITPATQGIEVWKIPQNSGLLNQEAQGLDPRGRVHVFLRGDSTVAGQKIPFHLHFWRDEAGKWSRINTGIRSGSPTSDRTKIAFDAQGNAYALFPGFRLASASAASEWKDWKITYTRTSSVGTMEPLFDRNRLRDEGVLSVFYQENSATGKAPLRILDFRLGATTSLAPSVGKGSGTAGSRRLLGFLNLRDKEFAADGRILK